MARRPTPKLIASDMPRFATAVRQEFPDFVEDFDAIESAAADWAQRLENAKGAVQRGQARAEENRQNNVEFLVAIAVAGLAVRVQQLSAATVSLVNKHNPHAAPPVARALFESCCVPIYLQRELVPRLRKGRTNQVHKLVFRLSLGSIGIGEGAHIKPIAVDSLLRSARAELTAMVEGLPEEKRFEAAELIEIYYGPLTELTHPNWGAINLGTELGFPPKFSLATPFDGVTLHAVVSASAYIMQAGGLAFDALLSELANVPMDLPTGEPRWERGETRAPADRPTLATKDEV